MVDRTPNFALSVKSLTDKKYKSLLKNIERLQISLRKNKESLKIEEKEILITKVTAIARLGKDSPFAEFYKQRSRSFPRWKKRRGLKNKAKAHALRKPITIEHVAYYDVYVRGTPIMSGYIPDLTLKDMSAKRDKEDRLHAEKGPALVVAGYAFYFWHDTQIPAYFIEDKKKLTAEHIFSITNAETRRIAVEIVGWDNLVDQLNPIVIDKNKNPEIGTLMELKIPLRGSRSRQFVLRVKCGTGRFFSIPVVSTVKTALEAQAWIWNIPPDQFKMPEVRT